MATSPYATVDDLHAYLGAEPPADCQRLLARAQELIDSALVSSFYATDTNGNPTDAGVLAGFNKAVCAQVEWWLANGGDEFEQMSQFVSFSIEGISATRNSSSQRSFRLCPRAWDALREVITGVQFATALLPAKPTI